MEKKFPFCICLIVCKIISCHFSYLRKSHSRVGTKSGLVLDSLSVQRTGCQNHLAISGLTQAALFSESHVTRKELAWTQGCAGAGIQAGESQL